MRTVRLAWLLAYRLARVVITSDLGRIFLTCIIGLVVVGFLMDAGETERFRPWVGYVYFALASAGLVMLPINMRRARTRHQDPHQVKSMTLFATPAVCLFGLDRYFPGYHLATLACAVIGGWGLFTSWRRKPES